MSRNMGGNASSTKVDQFFEDHKLSEDDRFFGFENFGATCYCNSVLQALYHCSVFRERVLEYEPPPGSEGSLLSALKDIFATIRYSKKRRGVIAPRDFFKILQKENEMFSGYMHQDAHEFLIFCLNHFADSLKKDKNDGVASGNGDDNRQGKKDPETFVHDIFEGKLTNDIRCLCCETVTSMEESFLDLSVDVFQNTSLTHCLGEFSRTETLSRQNKFFCDNCCSLQEAQKCMKVKRLPEVLALHLKRFKYIDELQRFKKLSYRVVFPFELKLCNTTSQVDADWEYELFAVVIHVGSGPNAGHYFSLVKVSGQWFLFDDTGVEPVEADVVSQCFGMTMDTERSTETGYILFYTRRSTHGKGYESTESEDSGGRDGTDEGGEEGGSDEDSSVEGR